MQLSIAWPIMVIGAVGALAACSRSAQQADDQAAEPAAQVREPCLGRLTLTVRNQTGTPIEILEVERSRSFVIAEVQPGTETLTIRPGAGVRYIARRIRDRVWLADEDRPARMERGVQLERSCRPA